MNHCPHCGSPVSELDRWCGICGGKLEAADAPADVSEFLAAEDEPTVSVRKVPSSGLKIDSGDTFESTAAKAPGKTGDMHEHASGFRLMGSMGSMSFGGVSSPAPTASVSAPEEDTLFFKMEHRMVRVRIPDIIHVQGMGEYLKIRIAGEKEPAIVLLSMKKLEESLPARRFLRIHKSYLVNLERISQVSKGHVLMEDGASLPVGDLYREALSQYVGSKTLEK